ncbi:MAG: hypothetical protein HYY24_17280 [Verrucomicrobia bacterium]|nr:hypothetical protein [Verrucomicrobiota bacterium]
MAVLLFINKTFAIEYAGTDAFKTRLRETALPYTGNQRPINAALRILQQPPLSCQTVVFESEYVDRDYQNEFSAFYSKAFKNYPQRCVRLHFFSAKIPKRTKTTFGRYRKGYLGFMVIRPTDLQRMGRTVLTPPITDSHRQFIHCQAEFSAHILGEEFTVRGMPFTQQDTQVGACAQASLWMLARYMSRRFGDREFLPGEINQLAKAHLTMGRPLPAERGLNLIQMLDALQGMGFSALSYSRTTVDDCSPHIARAFPINPKAGRVAKERQRELQRIVKLADIAYRYIESGFPVIFGTSNHALVGIGHTYDPSKSSSVAIQRIPAFFANNDNAGPYLEMPILTRSTSHLSFLDVQSIVAVVPSEVTLRGEEAEARAAARIEEFLKQPLVEGFPKTYRDWIADDLRPDLGACLSSLEYRTFLRPSVEFQANLRQEIKGGQFNREIGEKLLCLDYPRFIWITEVSSLPLLNQPKREHRRCLGRVVIDSRAPARTRGETVIHFADFLQVLDRQKAETRPWAHHPNTTPFAHKLLT